MTAAKNNPPPPPDLTDPFALGRILLDVTERAQPLLADFLERNGFDPGILVQDPLSLRPAYAELMEHLWSNPQKTVDMQVKLWQDWFTLLQESTKRFVSGEGQDLYKPEKGDRRFRAPAWDESAVFDFIKQSYLLTSQWIQDVVKQTEGLDDKTRARLDFHARQFINAMAPSNFLLTNPEVLEETIKTKGENLIRGLQNMLDDMERGRGELRITTTDYNAFKLGVNIAATPGRVVYQNDLIELIQYTPSTETVYKRPLLVVPPWINKYYILDLKPENSLIKWLVDQGHTVFVISWINPEQDLAGKTFDDYMEEGLLAALAQMEKATGEPDANVIGYCLGGTLLAVALSWLEAHKRAGEIASATFLTTLVDFEQAGELKIFIDEAQMDQLDREMNEKGFLPAEQLKKTFSLLRANDMIWSFVINNYLMGREPFPFDLLYWNDDSTNMPAAMQSFYMRKCYLENQLCEPGAVEIRGTPIDMHSIKTPSYFLSTKEDHIAPWQATYATTQMFKGPNTFTLAASGHVAGVINPPSSGKYCYWTGDKNPPAPDRWLEKAKQFEGSWWPHWNEWAKQYAGPQIPARHPAKGIENAPGSYVRMKAD